MSRERYYLEDRLRVPFSGSLKYLSEAVESPVIEEKPQEVERPQIFPYNTGESVKSFPRPIERDDI